MMHPHISADDIRGILESESERARIEATMIAELIAWAEKNAGKMLTKRNEPAGWHIRKEYGMTHLETDQYQSARYRQDDQTAPGSYLSALVCHSETFAEVPTVEQLRQTLAVESREAHQAARAEAITSARPETIARLVNALSDTLAEINNVMPYDFPGKTAIERAAGYQHGLEAYR